MWDAAMHMLTKPDKHFLHCAEVQQYSTVEKQQLSCAASVAATPLLGPSGTAVRLTSCLLGVCRAAGYAGSPAEEGLSGERPYQ